MINPMLREDMNYTVNKEVPLTKDQNEGVHFLLSKFNAILAFQAGYGKTYTSLTACKICTEYSSNVEIIIICPKAANTAFKKELEQKIKVPYSICTTDEKRKNPKARFHIFNYSRLKEVEEFMDSKRGMNFIAVLDEAHTLQNPDSRQNIYLRALRPRFKCVFALTATPLLNKLQGLYHVVNFVRPGYLGTYTQFESRYLEVKLKTIWRGGRKVKIKDIVGEKNLDELKKRLEEVVIIKRKQYNIKFHTRKIKLSTEEQEAYIQAAEGLFNDETMEEKVFSARLHDLQRVADGSHEIIVSSKLNSKEKALLKTSKEILDRGESALIYTEYEDTYKRLEKVFKSAKKLLGYEHLYLITGKVKYEDRVKVEKELGGRSLVIITRAGVQSINLQASNNLVLYNIPFSIGFLIQAIGRVARMDSKYDCQNIYMVEAEGTIDTYKRTLVESHSKVIQAVFGKDSNLPDFKEIDKSLMNRYKHAFLWKKKYW